MDFPKWKSCTETDKERNERMMKKKLVRKKKIKTKKIKPEETKRSLKTMVIVVVMPLEASE